MSSDVTELYRKYRPSRFSEVVGQSEVVSTLSELGRRNALPHCLLFSGPSGVGKTSLIRILKNKLHCGDRDYVELNGAEARGIDVVRDIQATLHFRPIDGECRIWAIDEAHRLTADAQSALLKLLEDTPSHVYFFLATTEPQKLLETIRTRCTEFALRPLSRDDLKTIVKRVLDREQRSLSEDVIEKIAEVSSGSARKALVLLHSVIGFDDEQQQLDAIQKSEMKHQAIELARLLFRPSATWADLARIIVDIPPDEAESVRWLVLSYSVSVALKNPNLAERAVQVIDWFRDDWLSCKHAGLVQACWELTNAK